MKKLITIIMSLVVLTIFCVPAFATTSVSVSWVTTEAAGDLGGMSSCIFKSMSTSSDIVEVMGDRVTIKIKFDTNDIGWVSAQHGSNSGYMPVYMVNYTDAQIRTAMFTGSTLQRGFEGQPVKNLQRALNAVGGYNLSIDGIYGPATETAVKKFQQSHSGLTVDGICGANTKNAILKSLGYIAD